MRATLPRCILGMVLVLTLSVGAVPAAADHIPPPPDCPDGEVINGWCVNYPLPYTVFEDPQPPPIPQQDTGNSGTGALAEGEEATAYPCYGLVQRDWTFTPYVVRMRTCKEERGDDYSRSKTRFTFYFNGPTGLVTAYGNVRWDVKWDHPTYGPPQRRMKRWTGTSWETYAYTSSRPDAIQVHSTVGYSQWGCSYTHASAISNPRYHYVRLPNGVLAGPASLNSLTHAMICFP